MNSYLLGVLGQGAECNQFMETFGYPTSIGRQLQLEGSVSRETCFDSRQKTHVFLDQVAWRF